MVRAHLRRLLDRLTTPSTGVDAVVEFAGAVRQMCSLLLVVAIVHALLNLAQGVRELADIGFVAISAALVGATLIPFGRFTWQATYTALTTSVVGLGFAMYSGTSEVNGQPTGALLLMLAWPILLAAYFCSLRASMGLVGIAMVVAGAERWLSDDLQSAPQRVISIALVFGTVVPLIAMIRMRSDLSVKYLKEAAIRDPLTGLLNRRGFEGELRTAIAGMVEGDAATSFSVLRADVDYFKTVNDKFGHARGDDVLVEVSTLLFLEVPPGSIVARVGGEEFGLLVPGLDQSAVLALAESLRRTVEDTFYRTSTRVTLSIGAVNSDTAPDLVPDELLRRADHALYAAKSLGRNRAVEYSDDVIAVLEQHKIRQEEASATQLATLLTLAEALDLRDPNTALHSRTVAEYAEGMARELGLTDALVERIRLAGLLHDIGKIGVPDSVLLSPGKLDDEQWERMRQHPEIGARMLNHVEYLDIRDWVIAHHERPDGRGYPFGLTNDEIPFGAKILAVADSYEAMTADRVYRKSPGHEYAMEELARCVGTQFDPEVVAAMVRYLRATHAPAAGDVTDIADARADQSDDGDAGTQLAA